MYDVPFFIPKNGIAVLVNKQSLKNRNGENY